MDSSDTCAESSLLQFTVEEQHQATSNLITLSRLFQMKYGKWWNVQLSIIDTLRNMPRNWCWSLLSGFHCFISSSSSSFEDFWYRRNGMSKTSLFFLVLLLFFFPKKWVQMNDTCCIETSIVALIKAFITPSDMPQNYAEMYQDVKELTSLSLSPSNFLPSNYSLSTNSFFHFKKMIVELRTCIKLTSLLS